MRSRAAWNVVEAGPGSGKTTVIVGRAAHLKSVHGAIPETMAFVTFTNNGASVLKQRLRRDVGRVGYVGTTHGMMLRLIRSVRPQATLIDDDDAADFLARSAKLVGYKGGAAELMAERATPSLPSQGSYHNHAARAIRAYRSFMRDNDYLDLDLVLVEGERMLAGGEVAFPWSYLFVDEFQDSSEIEKRIYLSAAPKQLFIVGDYDQSIFEWRGARPSNMIDVCLDPRFKRLSLRMNYRCPAAVCELANAVIADNHTASEFRSGPATIPSTDRRGVVDVHKFQRSEHEQCWVAETVGKLIADGMGSTNIAVICRTNEIVSQMKAALTAVDIPITKTERIVPPRDWKLAGMLASQLASSDTNWKLCRLIVREANRVTKSRFGRSESEMDEAAISCRLTPVQFLGIPPLSMWLSCNADLAKFGIVRNTHRLLFERIRMFDPDTAEELAVCLRAKDSDVVVEQGVTVTTVHGAKGCEWNHVFVVGMENGTFPLANAPLDEERRLFYVAATRSMMELTLTCAGTRMHDGEFNRGTTKHDVSAFLEKAEKIQT